MSKPVIVAAIIVIKSLIMLLMLFSSVVALAVSPAVLLPPARLADLALILALQLYNSNYNFQDTIEASTGVHCLHLHSCGDSSCSLCC